MTANSNFYNERFMRKNFFKWFVGLYKDMQCRDLIMSLLYAAYTLPFIIPAWISYAYEEHVLDGVWARGLILAYVTIIYALGIALFLI